MRQAILFTLVTIADALVPPTVDNTKPVGTNPITTFSAQFLGYQTANNSCSHRDLGFTGYLAGVWYAIYGDTLWCAPGVTDPFQDQSGFFGMVRGSVSQTTDNPLEVYDRNLNNEWPVPRQQQFVPFNPSWGEDSTYGFGGTSLIETDSITGSGAIFYVVNANEAGLKGAGVGKVEVINGQPTVTQRFGDNGYWWPVASNPCYGDTAAYRDENSNYIYAWGSSPPSTTQTTGCQYVYMVRVNAPDAFDLSKYQYWHGRAAGWSSTPLTKFNAETAVMWGVGQGQVVYSHFYNCYIFIHLAGNDIALRTAPSPEGPWSSDVIVYKVKCKEGGLAYAGVAHPYLDPSGETLVISYTNDPNLIEVIKVVFSK